MCHAPCRHTRHRNAAAAPAPPAAGGCAADVRQLGQRPGGDPLSALGTPQKPVETRELLAAWALLYPNPDYYQWAMVEKATGQVFGSISLYNSLPGEPQQKTEWPGLDLTDGVWEPGYCIGRKWWNKGFTTEALRAVVAYWFTRTDSSWLACGHAAANPASGRVMEKAGFVYHHNTVYHKFDGTPVECRSYLLTRKAFETA